MPALTDRVRDWRQRGFPSSSYDWRLLLEELSERNVIAFDFLGFGLSAKPRSHDYSLFWQADLTEELVRRCGGGAPVFVLAHDMGTSGGERADGPRPQRSAGDGPGWHPAL